MFLLVPFTFSYYYVSYIFYCLATHANLCIYFLLLPLLVYLFFLADPGHLHDIALSAFISAKSIGLCVYFFIHILSLNPLYIIQCFFRFHHVS